ncbi:GerAB/ArcD/ProY family transporter [Bacillus sp. DTU_2020_1000418_1_SI_GHA_SEK_038]|uniref:GerAB/ArcD/ProY family transporter n=1 Tax=Bacillus sp. DTU_2020_1000418_1_SI_GHA_SEK_038 TaxID=3077585 RepID=UPI0028EDBEE2|nr:GerAB/ArcD/ProY family transporter [Bacillus sp. DTU_2020_1000418_1_SI_GHA_SEK_038]WNS74878.1 GerAB/ArcD/ProY family transporter [Bacillus sp. DTU_2020_1000418_1_SI_GHA_SEK_038]
MQEQTISEGAKISPFFVFYLIISMQIGIGILGFQRVVVGYSGNDSWISVLFAGLSLHIIMWMIYKITETVNGDIVTAHKYIFGNIVGKMLSSIFIIYFSLNALTVVRTYVEVVQVWMFPNLSTFWFSLPFLLLCTYVIFGGFRTVVGISFFSVLLPAYVHFTFGFNLKFSNYMHLFPVWDHSLKEILLGSYHMSLTYLGFEIILFCYPFIKEPQKSKKWAHFALLFTTFIYTSFMIVTIVYFSEEQLKKSIWASLTMWKIVKLPFVERFEYIGIANWNLVILPNVCIALWAASRLLKRVINIQQRKGVLFIAFIILVVSPFFDTREKVELLNDLTGKAAFAFNFIYIPILFICILIAKKVKKS